MNALKVKRSVTKVVGDSSVPFFSPIGASFGLDLSAPLQQVLESGRWVLGPMVQEFERAFAAYVGTADAIGVANGTDALILALRAVGVESGLRVATVANAGYYASTAIAQIGAHALYVDVDPETLTMSPDRLASALQNGGISAVVVTHLYGQMADIERIGALCQRAGVPLVEDCAQAHGARRAGRQAGAWGATGCFSFYPTKNLGGIGDGGAVVTSDAALAQRIRALRQYGWERKYEVSLTGGMNSRLDELQAAVLLTKLPRLDAANEERRAIAMRYNRAFAGLSEMTCQRTIGDDHVFHLYVVRTTQRDALRSHLAERGVASEVHYPWPDHLQPIHREAVVLDLPVAEAACNQVLSLPCYPGLTLTQQERVIDAVRSFYVGMSC
jgi:dTDP-4-amino-4,6-dideoxygalactose transaminase